MLMSASYDAQFRDKCDRVLALFSGLPLPDKIASHPSPPSAFRHRAEFRLMRNGDGCLAYAMHAPGSRHTLVEVTEFPIAAVSIQRLMPLLLTCLQESTELENRLFYVEFLTSTLGETILCLIYHRALDDTWLSAARELKEKLRADSGLELHVIGRSKGQKLCVEQDFIHEQFNVSGTSYRYRQIEGSFTQPNAFINERMLDWAAKVTANSHGELLELYCGNGNFTLPLSRNFSTVLATEVSSTSIRCAEHNIAMNDIANVQVVRLSSEETVQALNRVRPFLRLAHLTLDDYHFSTVLVDPPRAGLDPATLALVQRFERICYISCNPQTLVANLRHLTTTHRIANFALFDQFPYTPHMECGVFLQRE